MSRVGVAVELWSESARPLIRTAADFARSLDTSWTTIIVTPGVHRFGTLSAAQQTLVAENTNLITWLGGAPFFCRGDDVAQTLLAAAKVTGVEMLIMGKPRRHGLLSTLFADHVSTAVLEKAANILLMFAAYPQPREAR